MSSTDERSAASPLLEASEFRLVVPSRLKSGLSATGALLLVLVPLAAVLAATRLGPLDTLDFWKAAPLFLLVVGLPLAVLWAAIMTRRIGEPVIELQPKAVLLPIDSSGTKRAEVPYESIEAANLRAYSRFAFVAVRAAGRTFTYATRSFRPPEAAEAFLEALRARIAMSPGGAARLAGMDRLTVLAQEMGSKRTWVTHALLVLIAVGFAIEHFTGALGDPAIGLGMIRLGANARSLVHEGQVFRLVSANFLHAGVLHIVLNSVALLSVGGLIERLVGGWAFLAIYLASGIGGALASAAFGHATLSIGASTAIFGLLGCLATASLHFGGGLPEGFRQSRSWWITTLGINACLPILVPVIDASAHIGGFITGALVLYPLVQGEAIGPEGIRTTSAAKWLACALVAVYVAGIALAIQHGTTTGSADEQVFIGSVLADSDDDPESLNTLGWTIATDPRADRHLLEMAHKAAARASEKLPKQLEITDTLATVEYRLGETERAYQLERRVLAQRKDRFIATQVARFLSAAVDKKGKPLGPAEARVAAKIEQTASADGARTLELEIEGLDGKCASLDLLARSNQALFGLIQIEVGVAHPRRLDFVLDAERAKSWPAEVVVSPAATSTTGCDLDGARTTITVWDAEPAALALP